MNNGGSAGTSEQMANAKASGSDEVLRKIVQDLEDLKLNQSHNAGSTRESKYKYLDDKALYSSDG